MHRTLTRVGVLLVILSLAGCHRESIQTGKPEGWAGSGDRWYRTDAPLDRAFRDLGTLREMNVADLEADPGGARTALVKRSLIRLYRTDPETIDSLFEEYVAPTIRRAPAYADLGLFVREYRREGYEAIRNHYREPIPRTNLGRDIALPYPKNLKRQNIGGPVRTQVYLNEKGEPMAIKLLDGLHPVLDSIALRATTQMRWEPAFRVRDGRWTAVPSWTRFTINFGAPR